MGTVGAFPLFPQEHTLQFLCSEGLMEVVCCQ